MQTDINYIKWIKKNTNTNFSYEVEQELKRLNII